MAVTKTRMYFEGQRLGNHPANPHAVRGRQVQGFYPPGLSKLSFPIIGTFGFNTIVTVASKYEAGDMDFVTFQQDLATLQTYLERVTFELENAAVLNHEVDSRKLGTLGVVVDDDLAFTAASVAGNISQSPFGTVRFSFSSPDHAALDVVVGDYVVINENGVENQEFGEIARVNATGSFFVDVIAREKDISGAAKYLDSSKAWDLRRLEAYWLDCVYRGVRAPAARTLAEGGFRATGLQFVFETNSQVARRSGVAALSATSDGPLYRAAFFPQQATLCRESMVQGPASNPHLFGGGR